MNDLETRLMRDLRAAAEDVAVPSDAWQRNQRRVADELRRLAATRTIDPHALGALPLVGLHGVDERGVLTTWCPRREAGTPTTA